MPVKSESFDMFFDRESKKIVPLYEFLAEEGVFVITKDGKGGRVKVKTNKQWEKVASNTDVVAIIFCGRSWDIVIAFVKALWEKGIKITGPFDRFLLENYKQITLPARIHSAKDRTFLFSRI